MKHLNIIFKNFQNFVSYVQRVYFYILTNNITLNGDLDLKIPKKMFNNILMNNFNYEKKFTGRKHFI